MAKVKAKPKPKQAPKGKSKSSPKAPMMMNPSEMMNSKMGKGQMPKEPMPKGMPKGKPAMKIDIMLVKGAPKKGKKK